MTNYSRAALVGDIGGTSIRFAITDIDELTIADFALLSSADFSGPQEAIERYLMTIPHKPSMVGLAIAGPVTGDAARMTNLPWSFTKDDIRAVTGAEHVSFVNDFEALALALPHLTKYDLHQVGGGDPVEHATKAVLGPGTGLGVAGLAWGQSGWVAVPSEGGHIAFAAQDRDELALLEQLGAEAGFLSAEEVVSGRGLSALYRVLAGRAGRQSGEATAAHVVKEALSGRDPIARQALDRFAEWLGRFAGDVALLYGARGGIYLGGGIAPNILDVLTTGAFRNAFESKGRLAPYLSAIPVYTIRVGADAGLRGAAVALSQELPAVGLQARRQVRSEV